MVDYYYLTPRILTDTMFTSYGGDMGNATAAQLQHAYVEAERLMEEELSAFLTGTVITGTYQIGPTSNRIVLGKAFVRSIDSVRLLVRNTCDCSITNFEGCAFINDEQIGIIDVLKLRGVCGCSGFLGRPSQVQVAFTSGLPPGIAAHPNLHHALSIVAGLTLQQMTDPSGAEGGPGAPGVIQFSSLRYSERRLGLRRTRFGSSPSANYAADLVAGFKTYIEVKLGW